MKIGLIILQRFHRGMCEVCECVDVKWMAYCALMFSDCRMIDESYLEDIQMNCLHFIEHVLFLNLFCFFDFSFITNYYVHIL